LYELRIDGRARLAHAFDHLMGHAEVASCSIETSLSQLRFVAEPKVGDALVERIYQEGGLSWCARYDFS
jgi:hypothetical protein